MAESFSRSVAELKQKMSRISDNGSTWRRPGSGTWMLDLRDVTLVNEGAVKFSRPTARR